MKIKIIIDFNFEIFKLNGRRRIEKVKAIDFRRYVTHSPFVHFLPFLFGVYVSSIRMNLFNSVYGLGLTALAQALDSKQAHTSFGKLPLSVEQTAPAYQFSKARRDDGQKIYVGELTKIENIGKNSPGPSIPHGKDELKFETAPSWSMGSEARNPEDKPKYDFYENALFLDDPIEADLSRKARCLAPKIGTEPRFANGTYDNKPGP